MDTRGYYPAADQPGFLGRRHVREGSHLMKRLISFLALGAILASACGGAGLPGLSSGPKVGMVTDIGQLEDKSFNEFSWKGVQDGAKAVGGTATNIVTKDTADCKQNIQQFVDQKYDIIVTVGFLIGTDTLAAAKDVPPIGAASEIHGDETFGLSLFTDMGLCLQLGFEGYETKLKRLIPVMEDLDKKNLKSAFLLIDLNDPAKINVQRRNLLVPTVPAVGGKGYRM